MIDNERATAINPGEAIEEKVSLSDRFGLWLGFHNCDQPTYLAMIRGYLRRVRPRHRRRGAERARAIEWAQTRGARSGPRRDPVRPGAGGRNGPGDLSEL